MFMEFSTVLCRVVPVGSSRREQSMYSDASKFSFTAHFVKSKRGPGKPNKATDDGKARVQEGEGEA